MAVEYASSVRSDEDLTVNVRVGRKDHARRATESSRVRWQVRPIGAEVIRAVKRVHAPDRRRSEHRGRTRRRRALSDCNAPCRRRSRNGLERRSGVRRVEDALVGRNEELASGERADGDAHGRRGAAEGGRLFERRAAVGGGEERGAGRGVEDGVVELVGRDDGVAREAGHGSEGRAALGDHDSGESGRASPQECLALRGHGDLSAVDVGGNCWCTCERCPCCTTVAGGRD